MASLASREPRRLLQDSTVGVGPAEEVDLSLPKAEQSVHPRFGTAKTVLNC